MKNKLIGCGLTCASLLLVLLVLEAGLRFKHWAAPSHIAWDDTLGWRTAGNHVFEGTLHDASGAAYPVRRTTDEHGFRMAGNLDSGRPRLLVLGDSFTYAKDVSDDETYFARLGEALDVEVFAYGCEGFGTLQEYMVLDAHLDRIQPDFILWQFCWNDVINNSEELERASNQNNNGWRRPYWRDGAVVYATPKPFGALRHAAVRHSRLLHSIQVRLSNLLYDPERPTVENAIREEGREHPGLQQASSATQAVLAQAVKRAGDVPILSFSVSLFEPLNDEMRSILDSVGITYIPGVAEAVEGAAANGTVVKAADNTHWNPRGHALAAKILAEPLRTQLNGLTPGH
jgi:hypothetical protein